MKKNTDNENFVLGIIGLIITTSLIWIPVFIILAILAMIF